MVHLINRSSEAIRYHGHDLSLPAGAGGVFDQLVVYAVEELEVDYDAPPLDIGFNARYLLDITAQLDSDTALFKLADPGSPTLVLDRDGAAALYVLMPMRV